MNTQEKEKDVVTQKHITTLT